MKSPSPKARPTARVRWIALCLALGCEGALAERAADLQGSIAAAQQGNIPALVRLAGSYERGDGVAQDFVKSNQLYCRAAARGDAESLIKLALIYSSGREMRPDEGTAALLLSRAAELGHARARELLQHVSRRADSVMPACLSEIAPADAAKHDAEAQAAGHKGEIEALVQRLAPQYSIDPDLVLAVVATESGFRPHAVSPRNAQGLMQLIPATAERFGVKKPFNAIENLKGGLAYLQWLMAYFEGDVALVLAAYNAGEEAVAKHRGIPPYAETRNYVRRITSVYKKASHPYLAHVAAPSPALGSIRRAAANALNNQEKEQMTTEMQSFVASDGLTLRYVIDDYTDPWREPETLVLLHAAMGSSRRFYAWVPHLARDYRVVRLDLRGHGESGAPRPDQMSFERLGQDAIELMDHLGLQSTNLAGSSAGAIISQSVAMKHPNRVKTLASFAAPPGMKVGRQDYNGWLAKIGAKGVAAFLRETIGDRMDLSKVEPGFVDWFIAEAARNKVESLALFVSTVAVVDLTPDLKKIQCPTLVVVPGADPIHRIDEYQLLEREIKQCEFVVYEGLPHNITDTVPDRCAMDLLRFLKSHK